MARSDDQQKARRKGLGNSGFGKYCLCGVELGKHRGF